MTLGDCLDLVHAARMNRGELRRASRGSRDEVLALQARHLDRLLAHAAEHSPFYQQRWGGKTPRATDLQQLSPLSRSDLIRNTEQILTDQSLSREALYDRLGNFERGRYTVVASSGTTGEPVVVPYSRQAWRQMFAYFMRGTSRFNASLLRAAWIGRRIAMITTDNPIHASTQMRAAIPKAFSPQLHLAAGVPLDDLIEQLQRFRPTLLNGYPSVINLLAKAQLAGEIDLAPERVIVSSRN